MSADIENENSKPLAHGQMKSAPSTIDADGIVMQREVQPPYPERRDGWITLTALGVIGGSALCSAIALLSFPYLFSECSPEGVCSQGESPIWASELIKLSLVSSLAFVMGTKQGQS